MLKGIISLIRKRTIHTMKHSGVLFVSDTTLRDGEQMPGGTLLPAEKVDIALHLEKIGVHSIDAGFPACCEAEVKSIRQIARSVTKPLVTALCRAKTEDVDLAYAALKDLPLQRRGVSIFIGASPIHREAKLGKTRAQIIDIAAETIDYALKHFAIVSFAPEDASRTEIDFLVDLYEAAIAAGAANVGFTDTIGCLDPESTRRYVGEVNARVKQIDKALFAIHFHNDLGMAVANSLTAIRTGCVDIFQGTLLGVGERAGNASLEQVLVAMALGEYPKKPKVPLGELRPACRTVAAHMGLTVPCYQPVVGENVFRTEAGIHQHGVLLDPATYELIPPEVIGAERELVLGKHSGRHALQSMLAKHGFALSDDELNFVYEEFKGYFEAHKRVATDRILKLASEAASRAQPREPRKGPVDAR
jgi:2-isopropylmalate synthase